MRQLGQSIEVRSFDTSPHHRMAPGAPQQGEKDKRQAVSQGDYGLEAWRLER
jgi:hypothetical protein